MCFCGGALASLPGCMRRWIGTGGGAPRNRRLQAEKPPALRTRVPRNARPSRRPARSVILSSCFTTSPSMDFTPREAEIRATEAMEAEIAGSGHRHPSADDGAGRRENQQVLASIGKFLAEDIPPVLADDQPVALPHAVPAAHGNHPARILRLVSETGGPRCGSQGLDRAGWPEKTRACSARRSASADAPFELEIIGSWSCDPRGRTGTVDDRSGCLGARMGS